MNLNKKLLWNDMPENLSSQTMGIVSHYGRLPYQLLNHFGLDLFKAKSDACHKVSQRLTIFIKISNVMVISLPSRCSSGGSSNMSRQFDNDE